MPGHWQNIERARIRISDIVGDNKHRPAPCLDARSGMTAQIRKPDIPAMWCSDFSIFIHWRMYHRSIPVP